MVNHTLYTNKKGTMKSHAPRHVQYMTKVVVRKHGTHRNRSNRHHQRHSLIQRCIDTLNIYISSHTLSIFRTLSCRKGNVIPQTLEDAKQQTISVNISKGWGLQITRSPPVLAAKARPAGLLYNMK